MTARRGDSRGRGGPPPGGPDDGWPDVDDTNPDSVPASRALVVQKGRRPLLVAESGVPAVAARLPVGMATNEQLDSFRELRTRLQTMASGVGLNYFTTLVVPVTAGSGASFVARNLAAAFTLQDRR